MVEMDADAEKVPDLALFVEGEVPNPPLVNFDPDNRIMVFEATAS